MALGLVEKKTIIFISLVCFFGIAVAAGEVFGREMFRGNCETWCGDPEAEQTSDNPYVQLARRNVQLMLTGTDGDPNKVFWLVWGYVAPESTRKGDLSLKESAVKGMDILADKLAATPNAYWDILAALESVRLFKKAADIPKDKINDWLEKLRPSVEANYSINLKNEEWMTVAPNTLHQSAAILQLAALLYNEPKYSEMAHSLVRKTAKYQEADGAFRYIRNSGPCQIYYNFDATFLGRYYQLSQDPVAKEMLIKMAQFSKDVLANGLMESSASPWWKHSWGGGGPIHAPEIIAGLARDSLTRSIAEYRLAAGQRYFYSYYPMFFWDPTIPLIKFPQDLCRFNTNIGGPQIRKGSWQVVMPGKAYADTAIGCSVVTGKEKFLYDAYLEVAALPILGQGVKDAYNPGSLIVAADEETAARASVVGKDWIAAGWVFHPRSPFYANPEPPPAKEWRLAQIWFADEQGFAGWLVTSCESDTSVSGGPWGYLSVGHMPQIDPDNCLRLSSGNLTLQVWGDQVQSVSPTTKGNKQEVWIAFTGAGNRAYKSKEEFGYGLSGTIKGGDIPTVQFLKLDAEIIGIEVVRGDRSKVILLFNPNETAQEVSLPVGSIGTRWRSTGNNGSAEVSLFKGEKIVVSPRELQILFF